MAAAPLRRRPVAPSRGAATARSVAAPAAPLRGRPAPRSRPAAPAVRHGAALLDRLLAGRLWIGLIFALLVGIVFFNVDLLRMNRDIAVTAEKSETLKRQNARLRGDLARLGSSERIQKVAAESGLVLPAPGEVRYLKPNAKADPANAVTQLERSGDDGADAASTIPPAQSGGSSGVATQGEAPTTQNQTPATTGTTTPQAQATTPQAQATPQAATPTTTATPPETQQQGAAAAPTTGQ